jgi:hypothetical protein
VIKEFHIAVDLPLPKAVPQYLSIPYLLLVLEISVLPICGRENRAGCMWLLSLVEVPQYL